MQWRMHTWQKGKWGRAYRQLVTVPEERRLNAQRAQIHEALRPVVDLVVDQVQDRIVDRVLVHSKSSFYLVEALGRNLWPQGIDIFGNEVPEVQYFRFGGWCRRRVVENRVTE